MKSIIYIAILLISTSLPGCFLPLPQWEMIFRSSDVSGQVNDDGYFDVWVDQNYWPNQLDLVGNLSWAENPDGERLNIDYEKSEKPYRGEWHYKIFPTNKKGNRLGSLNNGVWKLSLYLQKEEDIKIKELRFKLWTFFYNPLIHGAPN
jgi:hypothetical protein